MICVANTLLLFFIGFLRQAQLTFDSLFFGGEGDFKKMKMSSSWMKKICTIKFLSDGLIKLK